MQRLLEGIAKFQKDLFPQHQSLFQNLANGQQPQHLFITCADSRIVPDLITQSRPGDLFICRNAGNMVPTYGDVHGGVSATIEYAVAALKVKHIIVCGHTDCGVMKGILNPASVADMPVVKSWLSQGEVARRIVFDGYPNASEAEKLRLLTEENVVAQLDHLRTHPSVASSLARGELATHGWVYDIAHGRVRAWDARKQDFVPIEDYDPSSGETRRRILPGNSEAA
ncbi:MAG TPA: carbonic anhydrase [Bryobacteraceae bacterium]|nr:carbonic anhydrase [Bryobacteraceae bacterium]